MQFVDLFNLTHAHTATHSHKPNTDIQTQPHLASLWHQIGFLHLSRGGPMAAEGHLKRWEPYNRWCQIGCQLQHKWLSITSVQHMKRPLYRWLDFRQHRKILLPPSHFTALQEGSPHVHKEACNHAHKHEARTSRIHPYCKNVTEKHEKNTLQPTHDSFRKHITEEAWGVL